MTREEMLFQLESIRDHCKSMIPLDEPESVWKKDVAALDMAISALRQQETVTKCSDLYDEDGGEILPKSKRNEPLTLDELRKMDGEPVWIHFIGGAVIRNDGWFIVSQIGTSEIFLSGKVSVYKNFWYYGETWLAYRQKPEEGTR